MTTKEIVLKVRGEAELKDVQRQIAGLGDSYDKVRVQFQNTNKEVTKTSTAIPQLGQQFKGLAAELGLMYGLGQVTGMIKDFGVQSVAAARESATAIAELDTVLRSTQGVAGLTKEQLVALASAMQDTSLFSDEAVMHAESMLLTFTKIGKDVFPAATQATANLAQMMGGDLQGAAILIGKALNVPEEAAGKLTRAGIQLTEAQQEQIEAMVQMGNVAGAQSIILSELNTQFGGQALAAREAAGGVADLQVAYSNFQESFGGLILAIGDAGVTGALTGLFDKLTTGADAWQTNIDMARKLAEQLDELAKEHSTAAKGADVLASALIPAKGAFEAVRDNAESLITTFNPFAGVLYEVGQAFGVVGSDVFEFGEAAPVASEQWVSSLQAMDIAVAETTGNLAKLAKVGEMTLGITQQSLDAEAARWQGMANITRTQAGGHELLETMAGGQVTTSEEAKVFEERAKLSKEFAKTMASSFNEAADTIRSTIESVLKPSLDEVWQPPADDARFDESARRLATVATSGFSSEWLNQLTTQFAGQDFFQPIVAAMQTGNEGALKQAATDILTNQVTKLWDVEQIKAQVRAQLQQDQLREKLIAEIQQELGQEGMAVPIQTTAAAATQVSGEVGAKLDEATGKFADFQTEIKDQKWPEIGKSIVQGINKGIDQYLPQVKAKLRDLAKEAIAAAQTELGAHSPATALIPLGQSIGQGLIVGMENITPDVQKSLTDLLGLKSFSFTTNDAIGAARDDAEKFLDALGTEGSKARFMLSTLSQLFKDNSAEILGATDQAAKFWEVMQRQGINWGQIMAGGGADPFSGKGGGILSIWLQNFDKHLKEFQDKAAAIARENMQKMMGGIGQLTQGASSELQGLNQNMAVLQTLIRQGVKEFTIGGEIMDAAGAQERLNQMVAQQLRLQGEVSALTGLDSGIKDAQQRRAMIENLALPSQGSGLDRLGLAKALMSLVMPTLTGGLSSQLAGIVSGGKAFNIYGDIVINTSESGGSVLEELENLGSLLPGGT